jgi:hypothetical protein
MKQEDRILDYSQNILESFMEFKYDQQEEKEKKASAVDQIQKPAKNMQIAEN